MQVRIEVDQDSVRRAVRMYLQRKAGLPGDVSFALLDEDGDEPRTLYATYDTEGDQERDARGRALSKLTPEEALSLGYVQGA